MKGICTAVIICLAFSIGCGLPAERSGEDPNTLNRLDRTTISVEEFESQVREIMDQGFVPGLAVAVVHDGEMVYSRGFGVKDVTTGEPVRPGTSFAGLSFSKTVFSYVVMRLVDQGVLHLDRPLYQYLDQPITEFDAYQDLAGDSLHREVTARMVMSHTTGWPNWRWLTESGTLHFSYKPGERFSYSGEGFAFMQLVVEEVTESDLNQLAHDLVFSTMDMERTSFVWESAFEADYAEDHDRYLKPRSRSRRDRADGAGSLQTTVEDYARFLIAVMKGQGLSSQAFDEMFSPQVSIRHARMFGPRSSELSREHEGSGLAWGLGWGLADSPNGRAIFHTGNDVGSANYHVAYLDEQAAIVLMGNSQRLEGIAPAITRLALGDEASPFAFLGYEPYDSPRERWLRSIMADGIAPSIETVGEIDASLRSEDSLLETGSDLLGFERFEEASSVFEFLLSLAPASADGLQGLARAEVGKGRPDAAVRLLKEAIGESWPESEEASSLTWLHGWASAQAHPRPLDRSYLEILAGEYGPRRVTLREDGLYYHRIGSANAEPRRLLALSDEIFVIAEAALFRLRFELDENRQAVSLHGIYEGGRSDETPRSGPQERKRRLVRE